MYPYLSADLSWQGFLSAFTLVTERLWQYENNETDRTEAEIKRIAQEKLDNYIQKLEKNAIQNIVE